MFESLEKAKFNDRRLPDTIATEDVRPYIESFWENKEKLYQAAFAEQQKVIREGLNYRDFGVGAAALAVNTKTGETTIITGYNSKESPEAQKHCAEKRLFQSAADQGFDLIAGLVVVARHQADDISNLECTTLHPCAECRHLLESSPLTYPELPIVTMSTPPGTDPKNIGNDGIPDVEIQGEYSLLEEHHTLADLVAKHKNHSTK